MRIPVFLFIVVAALNFCCGERSDAVNAAFHPVTAPVATGTMIGDRFPPPDGFLRVPLDTGTFAHYLRDLPLEPEGTPVHLHDGSLKHRQDVHAAVIEMSVGRKDLQQCADAVMRLRAEYLYASGQQDEISFNFTNGFPAPWKRWRAGERINVKSDQCTWVSGANADAAHAQLLRYLDVVFTYAGTRSLEKELVTPFAGNLKPGDVFIQGGSPGHAMLVVDVARHADGRQAFMLVQSYMPAQDIHVVKNLQNAALGAWFILNGDDRLYTPEWTFHWGDRRTWP